MNTENAWHTCTCTTSAGVAAGIIDHVWTMGEFLLFRVPPWRQEVTAAQGGVRHQGENEELSALLNGLGRARGFLRVARRGFLTSRRLVPGMRDRFPALDAVWSFPWVWLIYPHRDGVLPHDDPTRNLLLGSQTGSGHRLWNGTRFPRRPRRRQRCRRPCRPSPRGSCGTHPDPISRRQRQRQSSPLQR